MNLFMAKSLVLRALVCAAAFLVTASAHAQTMVRLHTTQGPIDMKLLDTEAPVTVANFLAYVRGGDYVNVFFHRNAWISATQPFVIQSGGYKWLDGTSCCTSVASRGAVRNEFSATRSNVRGTVAMAKQGGDPNSATSQWFINMGDNAANLDSQNGGFSVFARVTAPGMAVADRISLLPTVNAGSPLDQWPLQNWQGGTTVARGNAVLLTAVTELPSPQSQTASDRIFNYLEAAYPQFLSPSIGSAGVALGYNFRYYSASNAYVGTRDGKVWYLVPALNGDIHELGTIDFWLGTAAAAGY